MVLNLAPQRADRAPHLTILLLTWLYVFINMVTRDFEIVSIAAVVLLFIAFTWRRLHMPLYQPKISMKALTTSGSKRRPDELKSSRTACCFVFAQNSVDGLMIIS